MPSDASKPRFAGNSRLLANPMCHLPAKAVRYLRNGKFVLRQSLAGNSYVLRVCWLVAPCASHDIAHNAVAGRYRMARFVSLRSVPVPTARHEGLPRRCALWMHVEVIQRDALLTKQAREGGQHALDVVLRAICRSRSFTRPHIPSVVIVHHEE